ncbi:reverse transcriptase [Tanacetum coccineum]|uniref:Reverse transcriptase n=1 Tax=Tanacetum coccineum TaxID=301880 RepID=A0ABQ5DRD5_9ASTR
MLMWKKNLNVKVMNYSKNHVDFRVVEDSGTEWRGSGIYGWPKNQDKYRTWILLRSLKIISTLPWVCFGDFNEVLYAFEKVGMRGCNMRELNAFETSCHYCNLYDLGFKGCSMTWSNGRRGVCNVQKRLDRFFATPDWSTLFPSNQVQNPPRVASDHSPIVLSQEECMNGGAQKRRFRFEHMWLRVEEIIEDAWLDGIRKGLGNNPAALVNGCAGKLTEWNKTTFGHVQRNIRTKVKRLKALQNQTWHDSYQEQHDLQNELKELYAREEIMWRQRSRIQWLKEGDKNTHFFHARASSRRNQNNLLKLQNDDGTWVEDSAGICDMVSSYFQKLFATSHPPECEDEVSCLDKTLCDDDIEDLERPVSEDEVYAAVMQMHPSKAPGPDGMTALFYQKFWKIVGPTVVNIVVQFFSSGIMPQNLNETLITLIPKTPSPATLNDLRPISLCNVIYKIISKVLVNRIKRVLPRLIDETQSAFVTGRMITDNAIVAFEVFHWLKNKRSGRKGAMAIKVDMSKAYDRVEWSFIRSVL